jgi:hypothetical protein
VGWARRRGVRDEPSPGGALPLAVSGRLGRSLGGGAGGGEEQQRDGEQEAAGSGCHDGCCEVHGVVASLFVGTAFAVRTVVCSSRLVTVGLATPISS